MTQHLGTNQRYTTGQDERSVGDLIGDVSSNLQRLLRQEVELAKIETKEQVSRAGKAGALFGATAVTGFVGLLLVAMAVAWGLAEVMAAGVAFLLVGVVFFVIAAITFSGAKKKLAGFKPVPEQTLRTLKEDVDVAKRSFSSGASAPTPATSSAATDPYQYWNQRRNEQ